MKTQEEEAPLVIEALQEPLHEALAETDTQPPVQNEDLAWRPFVLVVVYYFLAGIQSGRRLLTHLSHANPALGLPSELKKSTFFDAFRRFDAEQARKLFYSLLSRISFFPVPEMAALGVLCAVDGSHWPALFRMSWVAVGSNKPTVLLHLAFGLNQMIPVAMLLTDSKGSERNALKKMVQPGVTYVADRGYFAYYLLNDIAAASAFFVLRATCTVTYQVLEVLPVNLPSGLPWLSGVQDLKVHCDKGKDSGTWRVVRFVIGNSEFILFTNRWELTTWQIIVIYAYRWQIELFFLFVKRGLNGLHLLTHSENGLQIQFYLMLIATVLLLHFKQRNEAAMAEEAPEGEPVQVPPGSAKAAEQPSSPSQTVAAPAEPQGQEDLPEEKKPEAAAQRREETTNKEEDEQPDSPSQSDKAEPAVDDTSAESAKAEPARSKASAKKSTRQATIDDEANAKWYRNLGENLRTFWRIGVHWLQTLRDNFTRVWRPAVFADLPGFAKPSK